MFAAANGRADVIAAPDRARRGPDRDHEGHRHGDLREGGAGEACAQFRAQQAAQAAKNGQPPPPQRGGRGRGERHGRHRSQYAFPELIGHQGGLAAIHIAARQGSLDAVAGIARRRSGHQPAQRRRSAHAIIVATLNGQFDLAKALLDKGADPNLAEDNGVTPLYAAINCVWAPKALYPQPRAYEQQKNTYLDLMAALIDKGADPNTRLRMKVWYSRLRLRSVRRRRDRRDGFLARRLCQRRRRDEAAGSQRRRSVHSLDEGRRTPAHRRRTPRGAGHLETAADPDRRPWRPRHRRGGRQRVRRRLRSQLAPLRADRACWRPSGTLSRTCMST